MDRKGIKKARKTKSSGRAAGRKVAAARERISPRGDTRFVRRGGAGQFKESDDAGKSLARDVRRRAKTAVRSGQGDKGDQRRTATASKGRKRTRKTGAKPPSR